MTLLLKAAERLPMVGDHARRLGDAAYREPAVPPRAADAEGSANARWSAPAARHDAERTRDRRRALRVGRTLRTHTKHIFTKLDVTTRRAAVSRAAELGLL